MRYYDESRMHDFRSSLEKTVLSWPGVTTWKMFGCPCYKRDARMFAFLVTDGLVLTEISGIDMEELKKHFHIGPFQANKRTMRNWPRIQIEETTKVEDIIPYIKSSYGSSIDRS